jgi:hypothetical protein
MPDRATTIDNDINAKTNLLFMALSLFAQLAIGESGRADGSRWPGGA